jgi:thioredoxin-related protein
MKKTTIFATIALALTASFATASGDGWMTDFAAAKKKAAAEKKDLLVDFTGSDWCSWCIKLNDEVFKHDAFKNDVASKYILVELDYPRDKSKQSDELQKQNEQLSKEYSIKGFPTILLMDSLGRPFAKTGYQAGGPEKYIAHLDELRAKRIERDKNLEAANKLKGIDKANALVKILKDIPEDYLGSYTDIMDEITKLDPEDKSGFIAQQKLKQAKKNLDSDIMTAMRSGKGDTAPAMIDKFITDHKVTGEEKQKLLVIRLQITMTNSLKKGEFDKALAMVDDYIKENKATGEEKQNLLGLKMGALLQNKKFDDAGKVIDEIIAAAPDSKAAKFAEQFKPRLKQMKEAAAAQSTDNKDKGNNPAHGEPGHVHGK